MQWCYFYFCTGCLKINRTPHLHLECIDKTMFCFPVSFPMPSHLLTVQIRVSCDIPATRFPAHA